jgi:predicted GIY-YIG superfamily endonuclease
MGCAMTKTRIFSCLSPVSSIAPKAFKISNEQNNKTVSTIKKNCRPFLQNFPFCSSKNLEENPDKHEKQEKQEKKQTDKTEKNLSKIHFNELSEEKKISLMSPISPISPICPISPSLQILRKLPNTLSHLNKGIIETIINETNENLDGNQEKKYKVYVIECENNTFYVGVSCNVEERYKDHLEGRGALWTVMNKPMKYYIYNEYETRKEANVQENALTLSLMYQHSIPKVRGGRFSNPVLNKFLLLSLKTEMAHNESLCFQCFKTGHFIKDCPNNKIVQV